MNKGLTIASWICLGAAALLVVTALVSRWAINAEAFGAHDLGLAVFLAFLSSVTVIAATWSSPALLLAGLLGHRVNKRAGTRLLAAGVLNAVPLAWYTWF